MKKTSVMIMAVLSVTVLVFSATVFAGQSGILEDRKTNTSAEQSDKTVEKTKKKTETKLIRGTGAYKEDGMFRFFKKGVFKKVSGVAFCPEDGTYRYMENGMFSPKTGIAKRLSDGKPVYVKKGLFTKATGVAKRITDGTWLFVKKGVFKKATGIARRVDRRNVRVYVKNGVYKKKTGLVQNQKDQWVLLNNGFLVTNPKKFVLTAADEKAGRGEILCEVFARTLYQKIVKPEMTKEEKLSACFYYLTPEENFRYIMNRIPYYTAPDSAIVYTLDMIRYKGSTCHGFASLLAYLAKLCGYKNAYYCWSSYHGWAEIDGLIYDPVFLGSPHFTTVYATPYDVGREMGLGTDYVEMNRYLIPQFE